MPVPESATATLELPCDIDVVDTVAKDKFPEPSVCKNWSAAPSAEGSLYWLLMSTLPEPLGDNLRSMFVESPVAAICTAWSAAPPTVLTVLVEAVLRSSTDLPLTLIVLAWLSSW